MTIIHLPGYGAVDLDARKVAKALNEYDERLLFDRNLDTGNWSAWVKMPHGQTPQEVIVFGRDVPNVEHALARVQGADTVRQGIQMLEQMNRDNERLKTPGRQRFDNLIGEVAEVGESAAHREGLTPYHRSLPKRDPKHRRP